MKIPSISISNGIVKNGWAIEGYPKPLTEEECELIIKLAEKGLALKQVIKDMEEALEFYGKTTNWEHVYDVFYNDTIVESDQNDNHAHYDPEIMIGGKQARACLEKHKDILKEIK